MSDIRVMTMLRRMFSRKAPDTLVGIRRRIKLMKNDESVEDLDPEDVSQFEADFMNVGMSHRMYEREMQIKKERLKQQIVIQKYFKEKEPRFLTFAEKELIKKLHTFNPEEWTIEKLSESFPALPETIKKILDSKWSPKSVEMVVKYDNTASRNWKDFQAGTLPVSPALREHLMKFKGRKIIPTDKELLAKQFVPKIEFKKPKSQLFSSIIQTYRDEKEHDAKLLSQKENPSKVADKSDFENPNLLIANTMGIDTSVPPKNTKELNNVQSLTVTLHADAQELNTSYNEKREKLLTFDQFVKTKLENIHQESSEEGTALLNLYRKEMDASQEMQTPEAVTASENAIDYSKENTSLKIAQQIDKDISIPFKDRDKNFNIIGADDNLLDTKITLWKKKVDTELKYVKPIKIAKHLYKPGMTYRISDCYYDDDGEFLYRVPGVQS
ncbi:hypothetical protein PUN28_018702 [Cardiocondyla obscurior]